MVSNVDKDRNPDGTLKPGHSPLPGCGAPKLGAVSKIREARNEVLTQPDNVEKYKKRLQDDLDKNPVGCVDKYVHPIFPESGSNVTDGVWADKSPNDIAEDMMKRTIGDVPQ